MSRDKRRPACSLIMGLSALGLGLVIVACEREERQFREVPPVSIKSSYQENAYAIAEGKRLYSWFNCVGYHFHGGGGIGPPLMDDKWIYGSEPANIFASIVEGRPSGMPSFRGRIPNSRVWQLVAYVRSLSGLVPKDAAPGRDDNMSAKKPEQSQSPEQPKEVGQPR